MHALVSDLNYCSRKGLVERFDSTIGAGTVLMPFGGRMQLTPAQAMVAKFPVLGQTTSVSGMAWGFDPYLSSADPFTGSYLAVVDSIAKLIATGFARETMYLTLQEYFEKLRDVPERWGKPTAAVLGALMAQVDLGVGAIGGKDSMSGSFEDLDVPPTLVSFAVGTGHVQDIVSPEFKQAGSQVVLVAPRYEAGSLRPVPASMTETFDFVQQLIASGAVKAASAIGSGGMADALFKMCVGNQLGLELPAIASADMMFAPTHGAFVMELDANAAPLEGNPGVNVARIGTVSDTYAWQAAGETIDLAQLQEAWERTLEPVFPYRADGDTLNPVPEYRTTSVDQDAASPLSDSGLHGPQGADILDRVAQDEEDAGTEGARATAPLVAAAAKPRVIIPVFPGNNCEYDSAAAFERAGAAAETFIVNNLSPAAVAESTHELAERIRKAQILMIPGGFSGGDEPDGSAKFITSFFRAPEVTEAVRELLSNDGLILGICNGFQALVKLGLVPFGDIQYMDAQCPTLTFNTLGRHQSKMVRTRVGSTLSPWLSRCSVGDVHTVPISHGEGRFVASEKLLYQMAQAGQIATQYVNEGGEPSMNLDANPNGSIWAIEGITSPDGRILGKMGHTERSGAGLYKNIPDYTYQPLIEGGVAYFAG
ncbi:MAG: phosphoribosylformylglycinamidine synthase subunit PurQ [Eggerthellaceae bacterium]|nr:phosphoribosylformylglycinamidine synthase subunit PurQ [Eggerthellaceae bacterium]